MKTTIRLIFNCFFLFLGHAAFSQAICGFDAVHNAKMKADPVYRQHVLASEVSIREYIAKHPKLGMSARPVMPENTSPSPTGSSPTPLSGPPYSIPVVVHVIHTGGAVGSIYNPTDAQISGAISYLNAVYNGSWPGTQGAGDLQIQFVLAQRDPNCNPTNGINRVDGSGIANYVSGGVNAQTTLGTADVNVKNLIRWDPSQYYNIWVVDKIDGADGTSGTFVAGFAYFPGSPASVDGIVMLATQMISGQKTLPHEIGHAFNLYHPFQGSSDSTQCQSNTDCTADGDQVCDTDPISYHASPAGVINFNCRTGNNNPCNGNVPYAINTESNYMNYTNCYTLFTPGQKARMLAAAAGIYRSGLTTSQGGTAPDAGASPCVPKIDFELTGDLKTETTSNSSGCRSYTDYTYKMVIGNSPSAAATATLNVSSGTATPGLDFDLTTNGNFTSPSNVLNFAAGAETAQPFTIRIYDDASVNGARNFVLTFTVNNGGGNAVAGDGRPSFTMLINDNDKPPFGPTSDTAYVGPDQGSLPSPFQASSAKYKSQILYYASELVAAGVKAGPLSGFSLYMDKASAAGFVYQGMTIKMAQTTQSSLYNGSTEYPLTEGLLTSVYSTSYSTVNGWNTFISSSPITWNGTSNIVVEICYDNGATTGTSDLNEGYVDGSGKNNYTFQAINCPTAFGTFSYYNNGVKPIARFVYPDPGTTIQTVLNSSRSQYLGPNADIYFYDQTNNQLMARIRNLSSFDYGCTQIVIDRAGSGAIPFWNNNVPNYLMNKTFHVLPAANNSSGSYNITLYYTQPEVSGWQTTTGQILSNIQLVKVSGQIQDVTPASPSGGGAKVTGAPVISSLGTNTGLSYQFSTGFSGFGAGVPGLTPLPIGLLDFEGRSEQGNALLGWSTSFETNSRGFEVERSYDGHTFSDIGFVASAGNSSNILRYSYTDPSLTQEDNYYRLRQIDLDNKFTYSKVILIRSSNDPKAFTVLSNPFGNSLDILVNQPPAGSVRLRLLDITGKELLRQVSTAPGTAPIHMDLSGRPLSPGVYLLEASFNNQKQVQKVIKK